MRSSISHFKQEQEIVSQVLKTLSVNAFIELRVLQRQDLPYSDEMFESFDKYRDSLNKNQPMADFMFGAAYELTSYAATKQLQDQEVSEDCTEKKGSPDEDKFRRLVQLAQT